MKNLGKLTEWRILAILGIVVLSIHLISLLWNILGVFSDVFLLLVLSWLLSFILQPFVMQLTQKGMPRIWSAALVYIIIAVFSIALIWVVIPTTVVQISSLSSLIPVYLPENSPWTLRIENFVGNSLTNSGPLATGFASTLTGILVVFILSFYFLISREEISKFILDIIPDRYEDDFRFLESVINNTFASFLRVQVVLGAALGAVVFLTLSVLRVNFALSTAVISGILASIPVVGAVIFLAPVILATLPVSLQTTLIAVIVTILAAQLVYNLLAPKLLGTALRIHPIIVLLSFISGYKLAGLWGAIFAVPLTAAVVIIFKDLTLYWKEEADKHAE